VKSEKWYSKFESISDLTTKVMTSVVQLTSIKAAEMAEGLNKINEAAELGSSYLPNIQQQIATLANTDFVCIRLHASGWWNTRLHLVSALASDFTSIRQFVILDEHGAFVVMASPAEVRRALAKSHPLFETVHSRAREAARTGYGGALEGIGLAYPTAVQEVFPTEQFDPNREKAIKQFVTPTALRELGIKPDGEAIERFPEEKEPSFYDRVAQQRKTYIAVMHAGKLEGVVDRTELASRLLAIYKH
jgi:hypothetical protein